MGKYILRRVLYLLPMMFLVIVTVFLIMSFTPGDPATNNLPITAAPEVKAAYNESVGYTDALVPRFLHYMGGLLTGNVLSYTSRENIFTEIALRLPSTLKLGLASFLLAAILGVSLGIVTAIRQYSFLDGAISVAAVVFGSVPAFLLATLGIFLFSVKLGMFPSFGITAGWRSFVLPVASMTLSGVPMICRITRSAMLSVMNTDYIRTARAKGCDERRVIWKHVLKNASLPILTLLLSGLAGMVGGSVIIEQVFSIPGIGLYMLDAINGKNVPVVMTCALLLAFIFMLAMLLNDICYALIDPKVRLRYRR